jgi:Tol biopolymer transport system component
MKTKSSVSGKLPVLSLFACLIPALTASPSTFAAPPSVVRASVAGNGQEGNNSSSTYFGPTLSANGRFVVFISDASNLVPGDNNGLADIFVRDFKKGATQRVSVSSAGTESNGGSYAFALSSDGRYVAFSSGASNLVEGDDNGVYDVFVRDLKIGVTQRVSVDSNGKEADGGSYEASISANGRFVVFNSSAGNLVPGDDNETTDVFVRDLKTGVTIRASVDSAGIGGNSYSQDSVISANGRFVAFSSASDNLVPGDTNGLADIFVHDLKTGETKRASVNSAGKEASGAGYDPGEYCSGASEYVLSSYQPSISRNGRFVAFASGACNLVEGDHNADIVDSLYNGADIFVHDFKTGETTRVSVDSSGGEFKGYSALPAISANGRFVAFTSDYGGAYNEWGYLTTNVVVHDRKTGTTEVVSADPKAANSGYFGSYGPSVSSTGRFISFTSDSSNLVPGDNNNAYDVFVSRRW